jgi:hypothetical protein
MTSICTMGIASLFVAATSLSLRVQAQEVFTYRDLCDASAAVALGADHFAVADDERNTLRIYKRGQAEPAGSLDLSTFLGTKKEKESDLEGAAVIGTRIYWISSHGRSKAGKVQERRYRFFATEVQPGPIPALFTVGQPYNNLLDDLETSEELKAYKFADAARLAPEAPGGLNIEGLAATPDGKLLIGFRNPVPGGSALIVPIENPKDLVNGKKAKFGLPITLDLGGRGIRSIELGPGSSYLVVAGPVADNGSFVLYRWSGKTGDAARALPHLDFKNLRPEALFAVPRTDLMQILSDDGGVIMDGKLCKDREKSKQSFRSMAVKP